MPDPLARKLLAARLVLIAERAGLALFWPFMWLGCLFLLLLLGLPQELGNAGKAVFWVLTIAALAASLWPGRHFRWPGMAEAGARLERESGLPFRPLSALRDKLALGEDSIWAAHQARMAQAAAAARFPRLRLSFGVLDPLALRNALMLALVAAIALRGPQGLPSLVASFPELSGDRAGLQIDGWLTPPAYTAKPPVVLAQGEVVVQPGPIRVPAGSTVLLRVSGATRPKLSFMAGASASEAAFSAGASQQTKLELRQSGKLTLSDGWRELGSWEIEATADQKPQVQISGPVGINPAGAIAVPYEARDDHGVKKLTLRFALSDQQPDGEGVSGSGTLTAAPPQLSAVLGSVERPVVRGRVAGDLTKHAWAGLQVEAWLDAEDGARQHGASGRVSLRLPERKFLHPLAQALAEQRKQLLRDPQNVPAVVAALDALSLWPNGMMDSSGRYLELKAITRKLYRAAEPQAVASAGEDLWNLAVALEGGDLDGARNRLEAARRALEEALARGADEAEINRLLQELKSAMERYLAALEDAARRGQFAQRQDGAPKRVVKPEDLSRMFDKMQELARKGASDEARDMLSQLDQILKNLQMGQAGEGNGDAALMREFSKLMREQQQLMDRTFRLPEQADGEPGSDMPDGQEESSGLAQQQGQLGKGLGELMDRLGEQGMQLPDALGRAQKGMEDAGKALAAPDRGEALANQQQALNAMRESFDQITRDLMGEGQGEPGTQSREGEAQGETDPLGRPRAARGPEYGPKDNMVPGEAAAETARRILDELRQRSTAPGLNPAERDYLDRLLRGLY